MFFLYFFKGTNRKKKTYTHTTNKQFFFLFFQGLFCSFSKFFLDFLHSFFSSKCLCEFNAVKRVRDVHVRPGLTNLSGLFLARMPNVPLGWANMLHRHVATFAAQ